MSNGYGINAFGTYDYMSLMNDPALMAALQSYNPNSLAFKGTQQTPVQNQATDLSTTIGADLSSVANPSFKAAAPTDEGNGLLYTGAAATALAVGAIVCAKKGNGKGFAKVVDGFKTIFKGKPTRAMKDFTLNAKDGSRIVVEKGKIASIRVMGEETVESNYGKVQKYIRDNGLSIPKSAVDSKTRKLAADIELTNFEMIFNNRSYVIENGQVVKVFKAEKAPTGKWIKKDEIKDKTIEEILAGDKRINENLTKIMQGEKEIDSTITVNGYKYTDSEGRIFTINDKNNVTVVKVPGKLGAELNEAEQKAWLNKNSEVDKQVQELISKGRSEGIKVDSNTYVDSKGNTYEINSEGNILSIQLKAKKGNPPQVLDKDTTEFNAWLYDHKDVQDAIKKEFESGLGFDGATFMAA